MGIIPCAEPCRYQKEGYCELNRCTVINSVASACPYFLERSADLSNRITKPFYTDQLNRIRTGSDLF